MCTLHCNTDNEADCDFDRCEDALNECKISFDRLDGGMARPERTKALNNFKANPVCEVLLVSLRAGGVGYVWRTLAIARLNADIV